MTTRNRFLPATFIAAFASLTLSCSSSSRTDPAAIPAPAAADSLRGPVLILRAGARRPACRYETLRRVTVERAVEAGESEDAVLADLAAAAREIGADAVIGVRVTSLVPFVTNRTQAERTRASQRAQGTAVRFTEPGCRSPPHG